MLTRLASLGRPIGLAIIGIASARKALLYQSGMAPSVLGRWARHVLGVPELFGLRAVLCDASCSDFERFCLAREATDAVTS
jgi:hypothetical protein